MILAVFFVTLLFVWYWQNWSHPKRFPPGPRLPVPIIGDAYTLDQDLYKGLCNLVDRYGNFCGLWFGGNRAVIINDYEACMDILNRKESTGRQKIAAGIFRGGYSFDSTPGILFSHGYTWSTIRKTSLHLLRNLGMGKQGFDDLIAEEVSKFVSYIQDHHAKEPVNIGDIFHQAFITIVWRILNGESLPIDDTKLNKLLAMEKAIIAESGNPILFLSIESEFKSKILYWLGLSGFIPLQAEFRKEMDKCINDRKSDGIQASYQSLNEALQFTMERNDDGPLNGETGERNLWNVLLDLILAGSDTTGCALQWCFIYMILYPDTQKNILEDIENGTDAYIDAFIHEVHRKAKVVAPSVFHFALEDITYKEHFIPKGTIIIPLLGGMMSNPKDFPDPDKFCPERYLSSENGKLQFTPHPKVIPFGIGKRRCIGEPIAKVTLKQYVKEVVKNFKLEAKDLVEDAAKPGYVRGPKHFKIIFNPRT